jgi:MSHA biogenesis protein MshK
MAKPVSKWIVAQAVHCALTLGAIISMSVAFAEELVDPTRPPNAQGDELASNNGPVLQSILIGSGRKEAIISGRVVKVGDRVGDAYVIKIGDSEVVLANGSELQTLKLFPSIEKRFAGRDGSRASLQEK